MNSWLDMWESWICLHIFGIARMVVIELELGRYTNRMIETLGKTVDIVGAATPQSTIRISRGNPSHSCLT